MGNKWLVAAAALCVVSICKVTMCNCFLNNKAPDREIDERWIRVKELGGRSTPVKDSDGVSMNCDSLMELLTSKELEKWKELNCDTQKAQVGPVSLGTGSEKMSSTPTLPENSSKLVLEGDLLVQRVSQHEGAPSEKTAMAEAWKIVMNNVKTKSESYEGKHEFDGEAFGTDSRARIYAGFCVVEVAWCKSGNRIDNATLILAFEDLWKRACEKEKMDILEQNTVFAQLGPLQFSTQVADKVVRAEVHTPRPEKQELTEGHH